MNTAQRWTIAGSGLLVSLFLTASPAPGQETETASVGLRAGPAIPAGALQDIAGFGASVGGTLAYHFHPNFSVRMDVDAEWLDDRRDSFGNVIAPPTTLLHFGGGIGVNLPDPRWQHLPLSFGVNLGVGATRFSSEGNLEGRPFEFEEVYFTAYGGSELGYELSETVTIYTSGRAYLAFADEGDTVVFAERSSTGRSPAAVEPFESVWSFPVTVGVRLRLQ